MPRRGENIRKRKDGRWEGRYIECRIDGKAKYKSVFAKTYKEVREKLETVKKEREMGKVIPEQHSNNQSREKNSESESFSFICEEWLSVVKPQLKVSSVVKFSNIIKLYLLPEFSDKQIVEISRDDAIKLRGKLLESGGMRKKGLAPKTVASILSVLKNIMEYSRRVKNYEVDDITDISVKLPPKAFRILSRLEQQELTEYLIANLTLSHLGILLSLYTGIRIGEICALKWKDFSFEEKTVFIHQTMQRIQNLDGGKARTIIHIAPPKSNSSIRKVPIPDEVFHLIANSRCLGDTYFLTGKTRTFIEPRTMENHFKAAITACKISDATFHTCRHTFATRCVELGFDAKSLSEILGHANVNITMNRYIHPSMELKQKHMNRLSDLFRGR